MRKTHLKLLLLHLTYSIIQKRLANIIMVIRNKITFTFHKYTLNLKVTD